MTNSKPYRHRFLMTIIQHSVWLYHRFPLSDRDVQELLYRRSIVVSHETLREWCVKFSALLAEALRHREPRHCLWRAVDEHGFVLDILPQRHHDIEATKTFLIRLLAKYDVSEVIHTDQLRSYVVAIQEIPSLADVGHQQVISTARCNNLFKQSH